MADQSPPPSANAERILQMIQRNPEASLNMADQYPLPGTNAERILQFIRLNPEVSINYIWTTLKINPSPVRKYLAALMERKLIYDEPDEKGHHRYRATDPLP